MRTIPELVDDAARRHGSACVAGLGRHVVHVRRGAARDRLRRERPRGSRRHARATSCCSSRTTRLPTCSRGSASCRLGAVVLPVNPRSTADELVGFLDQDRPTLVIRDPVGRRRRCATRRRVAAEPAGARRRPTLLASPSGRPSARYRPVAPRDPAVLIPTSGTTGRSKLVTQTHQGYVLAAEGFPFWLRAHRATTGSSPRCRSSTSTRRRTRCSARWPSAPAWCCSPRYSPSGFLDAARRHGATEMQHDRRDARDAHAPARATGRRRQPAAARSTPARLPSASGSSRSRRASASRSCAGTRSRRARTARSGRAVERPYETLGVARQHPTLGHINDARVCDDDGDGVRGRGCRR